MCTSIHIHMLNIYFIIYPYNNCRLEFTTVHIYLQNTFMLVNINSTNKFKHVQNNSKMNSNEIHLCIQTAYTCIYMYILG